MDGGKPSLWGGSGVSMVSRRIDTQVSLKVGGANLRIV